MNEYLVGDIVWAKLTGYPWWPAKVVDEKSLNKRVLAAKPKSSSAVWPVLFFGSFDYGWFGQENLCYFDEGLTEHGSLNRRGNLFAQAVKQAQDPQSSEDFEESDEKPTKSSNKRSTRPGSQNVSRNFKRNPSPAPKEKKAKTEKETSEPASDQSNSTPSSPARRPPAKRPRPVSSRNSKESVYSKTTKLVSEKSAEKGPEQSASKTIAKSASPTSPLLNSPKPHQPSKKSEEEAVPKDILEMRALRVSLQKATFPANYKDPELIDKILTILENGDFSPQCLIAAKMAKLMRHIHSHNIPKNKYNFSERIRLLGIRFKAAIDPKSSDSIKDSKVSESEVQSSAKKTKGLAKSDKPSSSVEPANDGESETDKAKNKEVDEAILSLISEPNEKDDTIDSSSEKSISNKLISDNFNVESLPDATKLATKLATENGDSSDFVDANNLKKLNGSKKEEAIEKNPSSPQKVSKTITSQTSSPHTASSLKPTDIHNSLNHDGFFKPELSPISSELVKESTSTSTFSNVDPDRDQKVTLAKNSSSESNLSVKQEINSVSTPSVQTFENPSTKDHESASGLNGNQLNSLLGSQNKNFEPSFNQGQVSSDEAKVDSSHDVEKEASTVSPPSVASPVAERTSITADSPSSSRATIASL